MLYTQKFYTSLGNSETKKFELVNYAPEVDMELDELLSNENFYKFDNVAITSVEKLQSESTYNLYKVEKFDAFNYGCDKEEGSLEKLDYYFNYSYVMTQD